MEDFPAEGIFHFEVEGRRVLGFDTGLSPEAFAKARLGSLMTVQGLVVDSAIHQWNLEGTVEHRGHMVFYGSDFAGESLEKLLTHSNETALKSLQQYLKALAVIADTNEALFQNISLFPAGVLLSENGSVLFTPQVLAKRVFEFQTPQVYMEKVAQWLHPDKRGTDAVVFTAAALLYKHFAGVAPYAIPEAAAPEKARELLAQNMRDGLYRSIVLAAPDIVPELAKKLDTILCPDVKTGNPDKNKTSLHPRDLFQILGEPGSKKITDFYSNQGPQTHVVDALQRDFQHRQRRITVQRFFRTYKYTILTGLAAVLVLLLVGWSILSEQRRRPSTKGMAPLEVAETYYRAFNTLDHMWMDACVDGGVGKGDIDTVMNLFVISRVREAYERKVTVIDPETWKSQGSPVTEATIFGITDLNLELKSDIPAMVDPGDRCQISATYSFYYPYQPRMEELTQPGTASGTGRQDTLEQLETQEPIVKGPVIEKRQDLLTLEWTGDRWIISGIERTHY